MPNIKKVSVRKILDSRGSFTVEVKLEGDNSLSASTSVPNSTSTGKHEVKAFPDADVDKGIRAFSRSSAKFIGMDPSDQYGIDAALHDLYGENLEKAGGNICTGVSISAAKLAALSESSELYSYISKKYMARNGIAMAVPKPIGNLIGGGVHSKSRMAIQEILISSEGKTFMENAFINAYVHEVTGERISRKTGAGSIGVNVEGAWCTGLSDMDNIALAKSAAADVSNEKNVPIAIGIDFAASEFYENGVYVYNDRRLDREQQIGFAAMLSSEEGIVYLEDPLDEDDFEGFSKLTKKAGARSLIVGDDLYTTNPERVKRGVEHVSTNAVLVKVNQIGTLSDTFRVVDLAKKAGMEIVVSHRSRDTHDAFLAHLAVAFGAKYIKCGIVGGERVSKLNELARIEELEGLNSKPEKRPLV